MRRNNKMDENKQGNTIDKSKSHHILLSDAPLLYQRSTELLYRLDHLRFHSNYDFDQNFDANNCKIKDLVTNATKGVVETSFNDDVDVEEINHSVAEIKTDLEPINPDEIILQNNDNKKDEKINEIKGTPDLISSYKMYLRGLHWFPSSSSLQLI